MAINFENIIEMKLDSVFILVSVSFFSKWTIL